MSSFFIVLVILGAILFIYFHFVPEPFSLFGRRPSSHARFERSELVRALLGLNDIAFVELMGLYRKEFGPGAARYARRTYEKWKTGKVQPATQTFERFLLHLPKVMTYDLKCEVLRHLMEEYAAKDKYELDVYTDDWEEKLEPLVRRIIDKAFTAQLPAEVENRLRWLGDGDMRAAQEILRASQAQEGQIMVSMLREEFENMERLLAEEHLKPKVAHVLRFPYGTIRLNIRRRPNGNG